MIKVKNTIIPFGRFNAMAIWPFIFYKERLTARTERHERIHGEQQKELLLIFFYILYGILTLIQGYRNNLFEVEAYANDYDVNYLKTRKKYAWLK